MEKHAGHVKGGELNKSRTQILSTAEYVHLGETPKAQGRWHHRPRAYIVQRLANDDAACDG